MIIATTARRMFELLEPICLVTFMATSATQGQRRLPRQAPTEGRVMYAGMRILQVPSDPVALLWHSATMPRGR